MALLNSTEMILIDNYTNSSNSSADTSISDQLKHASLSLGILTSSISVIALAIGIVVLKKNKKMLCQIRRLSYNALVSDLALHAMFVVSAVTSYLSQVDGESLRNDIIFHIRALFFMAFHIVSLASIAGLTFDRLVGVKRPLRYKTIMNKATVNAVSVLIWATPAIIIVVFIAAMKVICNWDISDPSCYSHAMLKPTLQIVLTFAIVLNSFIVCSYFIITKRLRALLTGQLHQGSSSVRNRNFTDVTRIIVRIVLVYEVLNLPFLVSVIVFLFNSNLAYETILAPLFALASICLCCNTYISFYFYVWRIQTCKDIFLKTFLPRFSAPREQPRVTNGRGTGLIESSAMPGSSVDVAIIGVARTRL